MWGETQGKMEAFRKNERQDETQGKVEAFRKNEKTW
jgi:hypothetical protein